MNIFDYIKLYLIIGVIIMAIFDIGMHLVKKISEQNEMPLSEDITYYTFSERVYIVFLWPHFLIALISAIKEAKNKKD
jgi:hypothetical protein